MAKGDKEDSAVKRAKRRVDPDSYTDYKEYLRALEEEADRIRLEDARAEKAERERKRQEQEDLRKIRVMMEAEQRATNYEGRCLPHITDEQVRARWEKEKQEARDLESRYGWG